MREPPLRICHAAPDPLLRVHPAFKKDRRRQRRSHQAVSRPALDGDRRMKRQKPTAACHEAGRGPEGVRYRLGLTADPPLSPGDGESQTRGRNRRHDDDRRNMPPRPESTRRPAAPVPISAQRQRARQARRVHHWLATNSATAWWISPNTAPSR